MPDTGNRRDEGPAPFEAQKLRRDAEQILDELSNASDEPIPRDIAAALHGLRVHQIELGVQNEELRRAHIEADEQRVRYFELFDLAPVGYLTLTDEGIVNDANFTAVRLLGVERQILVGQPFSAFVLSADRDAYYRHIRALETTDESQSAELRLQRLGGTAGGDDDLVHFWALLGSRREPVVAGIPPLILVTFVDVEDPKRAEAALRDSEERLRRAVQEAPVPMMISADDGEVIQVNREWERITGYSLADTPTIAAWAERAYGPRADAARKGIEALYTLAEAVDEGECRIRTKRGEDRMWQFRSAPLGPVAGGRLAVIRTANDVTERNRTDEQLIAQNARLERALRSTIEIACDIVEERDPYTAGHQRRVCELAVSMSRSLGMSTLEIEDIRVASLLHDIGKVSVPSEILSKPGAVSPAEYALLRGHAEAGYRIIAGAHMEEPISELVHQHHERCDGSGYPQGLAGEQILLGAKVIAVADVVEAMSSHRPYRAALGIDTALAEIERGAGTLYDADVARACIALFREQGFELSQSPGPFQSGSGTIG